MMPLCCPLCDTGLCFESHQFNEKLEKSFLFTSDSSFKYGALVVSHTLSRLHRLSYSINILKHPLTQGSATVNTEKAIWIFHSKENLGCKYVFHT